MPRVHSPTPTSFPELLIYLLSSPLSIPCKCSPLLSHPICPPPASRLPLLTLSSNHAYLLLPVPPPKRPCSSSASSCLQVSSSPRGTGQVKPWLNIGRLLMPSKVFSLCVAIRTVRKYWVSRGWEGQLESLGKAYLHLRTKNGCLMMARS